MNILNVESGEVGLVVKSGQKRVAMEHFAQALNMLKDPRRKQGLRYPLRSVVITGLLAMICGADDAQALQTWGEIHDNWLSEFLELPHGVPTQDVFLSVFAALDPAQFSRFL